VKRYSLGHLPEAVLHRELKDLAAQERGCERGMCSRHIAEVDFRKAFVPEAYDSMSAYCVGELRLSEDAAAKRIQVARVGAMLSRDLPGAGRGPRAPERAGPPCPAT
jgi:hypothetical protein